MILTNNRFGDIIMENTNFDKHYDVFHAFLVKNAEYDGYIELPKIKTSNYLPTKLIQFSKAMAKDCIDFDCWVKPKQLISKSPEMV